MAVLFFKIRILLNFPGNRKGQARKYFKIKIQFQAGKTKSANIKKPRLSRG